VRPHTVRRPRLALGAPLRIVLLQVSARPPTRVWEVVRTVAAPPSIIVKCGGVFLRVVVCGGVLVVSCRVLCVSVRVRVVCLCGVVFVCVSC